MNTHLVHGQQGGSFDISNFLMFWYVKEAGKPFLVVCEGDVLEAVGRQTGYCGIDVCACESHA